MKRPLEGIRVLDLTQAYSGPFCTMNLADHGAEVIKIERPGSGDQTRAWGPMENDFSGYYAYINRNKKGITLNLASEEGKKIFTELVKTADVICENYKVGVLEKLGFSYDVLKEINPRIIYGSISGFGLTGDLASRPCYDIVAQAMSGMMSVTGFADGPPCKIGPSVGDSYTGAYLCMGVLMALYEREKTGVGRRIDVAMVDTLYSTMENFVVEYTIAGKHPHRAGNQDPSIAPFDSFHAKDCDFVMGCGTDKMFAGLCNAMNREDLINDPRFLTNLDRCDNYLKDLKPIIEEWTQTKTVAELEEIICGLSIPFGPILTIPEISDHSLIKERNMLWDVYQPGMNKTIRIPGSPIKIHGEEDVAQKGSPILGEDNAAIFKEVLGLSDQEIKELEDKNVI
ncbi:CaiB/BaiF CoA transferase family protein [Anaerotignum sp.]|uniref:CaiB/BaiF CoA transferase family protein n=1 Tax=Anaerotignum sp. TaxID=2039241 RepID=UPI002714CF5F|nr:CaiB/BaiF CoA-transferase family protein [Anaerotignum sp.]